MEIRALREEDAASYWHLRLEALQAESFAFGKSAEEHEATPVEVIATRLRDSSHVNFPVGALDGQELIGTATFIRATGFKERHKAHIYGVYVTASRRGQGVGRALLTAVVNRAREDPSLEQILLTVAAGQTAAGQLYRQFGFKIYGTEPSSLKVGSRYMDEDHMLLGL